MADQPIPPALPANRVRDLPERKRYPSKSPGSRSSKPDNPAPEKKKKGIIDTYA